MIDLSRIDCRAAFEAEMGQTGWNIQRTERGDYRDQETAAAWSGWHRAWNRQHPGQRFANLKLTNATIVTAHRQDSRSEIRVMGGAGPQLADARPDASGARGSVARVVEDTPPATSAGQPDAYPITVIHEAIRIVEENCNTGRIDYLKDSQQPVDSGEAFQQFVIDELGPEALAGGKISVYEAARTAWYAAWSDGYNRRLEVEPIERESGNQCQPIETAPKDGTRILSCRPDFGDRPLVFTIVAYEGQEWHQQALMGGSLGVGYYPTHWMPLPAPPEPDDIRRKSPEEKP